MDLSLFSSNLEKKLRHAPYDPALGIRLVVLEEANLAGKPMELLGVEADPGKELVPHLHEGDEEIVLPITKGVLQLGKAQKDESGNYKMEGDKIVVSWNEPMTVEPGKALKLEAGEAHFLHASGENPFVVLFLLPKSHHEEDRKFVTHP